MRVDLKVSHTPDLKSKQPWPRLVWQGIQVNNLLMIDPDSNRLKVLCLTQSGKGDTKKRVARLQARLQHVCATKVSSCGNFLVCLQHSGDILVWHKDTDKLQTIHGIPELVTHIPQSSNGSKSPKPQIFISKIAHKLLVVIGCSRLFLWEMDQSGGPSVGKQASMIRGSWSHIGTSESHVMPSPECKEAVVHAQFFIDVVLGDCCICSIVFNHRDQVHVTSVILKWTGPQFIFSASQPRFIARWDSLQYPISSLAPDCRPVRHHGAYIIQHSHCGNTLAVAANQRSPFSNRVMFLSVMASGAVVVDLKGCGCVVKKPNLEYARSYWIGDLAWTSDDLFLVCITKRGSMAILSRLGEPLVLQSRGCSVEYGPKIYLPFHPLITIVPNNPSSSSATHDNQASPTSSIKSEADEKRQRFSVATHPTKPLIVCSDGYLATIMELPESLTCTSLMTDFLSEGRTALNMLSEEQDFDLRRLGTIKFQKTLKPPGQLKQSLRQSQFGDTQGLATSKGLITTVGSETGYTGLYSNLDEGKIVFGFPLELEATQKEITREGSILSATSHAQRALFSTLGLGLSYSGTWTTKLDNLLLLTARSIVRLCEIILLDSSQPVSSLGVLNRRDKEQTLSRICNLFQGGMNIFLWDMNCHNSQSTALKMSHWIVRALLRHARSLPTWLAPRSCVAILQFSERLLSNVYTMVPIEQPSFHIKELSFHQADLVEGAHFLSSGRKTGPPMGHIYTYVDGSERSGYSLSSASPASKVPIMCLLGKRLIQSWKLLHEHLNKQYTKLLSKQDSTTTQGGRSKGCMRKQRQLLALLCGVQRKLHHLGWTVPLSFSQLWVEEIHKGFLKGCEWYINGYIREAIQCWHLTTLQAQTYHTTNTPLSTSSTSSLDSKTEQRPQQQVSGTPLLTASLVAILYTHLENYDLLSALKLADKLIHCYQGDSKVKGHRTKKGTPTKLVRTGLSFLETIKKGGKVHFTAVLPCIPLEEHRAVVASLARWMALYFTNQPLYIYPACSAILMPSLLRSAHSAYGTADQPRTLPLYHDHISSAIRQQDLSEIWTADNAVSLFLVCGLVPEAVWLAKELGDWKSAFTLAVLYSEQNSWVIQLPSSIDSKELVLPGHLTPDAIMKEGLGSLLQTSPHTPSKSKLERRASMGAGSNKASILKVPMLGSQLKRTSSMRSIHDEDKASQEQRSRSLTDMLTAATLIGLDPTLWLLGNLTDACLSLVGEFNTLVPDDFYLPAPPYYCPQPEYIPKQNEAEQVVHEVGIRRKVNDIIQVLLLVLNSSSCSLPCAKWYVQQLASLLKREGKKKKGTTTQLPKALATHTKYQLDLLEGFSTGDHLPPGLSKLLQCFRNLCTMVWLLHTRDRLSMAIRQYQARREKLLRVKPEDAVEASQHKILLMSIIEWAGCLHPFMKYLQIEDEIQDVLLTAISELPANKQTVNILARYFHGGEEGLFPAVTEKFARLMEKLKRKREVADKKHRRREGKREDDKNNKTVKYESLYRYYKRQCQRRKVELNNRKDSLGSFEEHIFDPDPDALLDATYASQFDKPSTSKSSIKEVVKDTLKKVSEKLLDASSKRVDIEVEEFTQEEEPMSPRQAAHSHPNQKRFSRQSSFTPEEDLLPVVGSREFESSALYLDFLETFFLVAFGKIAQNLSPSTKPDGPLLGMFCDQLKKQELNPVVSKMLSRQKSNSKIELDISSTLRLPPDGDSKRPSSMHLDLESSDMEDERTSYDDDLVDQLVPCKGLFCVLGKRTKSSDALLNETVHGKIFDEHGYSVPPTPTPRKRPSEDFQFTGSFLHNEPSKPYTNVRLNLGKKYQKHVDLLQWLSRWTERQQRLHHGGAGVIGAEGSKAVLRVQLPQQLMLNSLWLLENCYYPDLFQQSLPSGEKVVTMPSTEETTSISTGHRVQFNDMNGRRSALKEDGGKRRGKGKGEVPVVQAHMKPSSSSEDLVEDHGEVDEDMVTKMRKLMSKKKSKKRSKDVTKQDVDGRATLDTRSKSATGGCKEAQSQSVRADSEVTSETRPKSTQKKSQDGERGRDKSKRKKKKRHLPEVTSEHLSTAVDYETEARKARERLTSPSASLRASPLTASQRLSPERDDFVEVSAGVAGVDDPDGGHVNLERQKKQRRIKVRQKEGEDVRKAAGLDSDSDSSSLNVSSLDEEEVAVLEKEITGGNREANTGLSLKSSQGDVRKMVREEFRKMMGKSILEMLNTTSQSENSNTKPKPTVTSNTATKPQPQSSNDPLSLLHPQAQSSTHGVHTGTQAPQLLLQTWHGDESMLHHQSLRGAKSVKQGKNDRRVIDNKLVKETRDMAVSPFHDRNSVLDNQQETQDNHSAVLPSDSSGNIVPPLTLQDLDSEPNGAPRQTGNYNEVFQNGRHHNNSHFLPQDVEINRNNNANENDLNSQNAAQTSQNGWQDDEYDTIPTRDSDEFIPSNSSSSHIEGAPAASTQGTNQGDPRHGPPPDYHNTYAFAHPQMPPLLRLDFDGPQSYRPPPPPPLAQPGHGFPPFTPREVWTARGISNQPNMHQQRNEFPYDRHHSDFDDRAPYGYVSHGGRKYQDQPSHGQIPHDGHDSRQQNSNLFLPQIPLLTLGNRDPSYQPHPSGPSSQGYIPPLSGPSYQPPPSGPSSQGHIPPLSGPHPQGHTSSSTGPRPHMPLLTLDSRPSYHHHDIYRPTYVPPQTDQRPPYHPHEAHPPSGLPLPPPQVDAPMLGGPQPPQPMHLLHLDEPPQPYLFKSSRGGVGSIQLVPPEEIIAFEQQKYKEKVEKFRQQQDNAEQLAEGEVNGSHLPLLHLDREEDDLEILSRQRKKTANSDKANTQSNHDQPSAKKASSSRKKSRRRHKPVESTTTSPTSEEDISKRDMKADSGRKKKHEKSKPKVIFVEEQREEQQKEVDQLEQDDRRRNQQIPSPSSIAEENILDEQSIDKGYAIKPGSYDAMLNQRDTCPPLQPTAADIHLPPSLQPTSAEIHLNVVRQLQEPPKPSSRDAASMTMQQRDVATSMDANGLPLDRDSRFGGPSDPVSQYTTAATGINNAGRIVAPDIFFGLRFGGKPDAQAQITDHAEPTKDRGNKPSDKGHDFISVVDMDSDAVGDLLQRPQQPVVVSKHRPDDNKSDSAEDAEQGVVDSHTGPEPSVAELHYNSLFHRDAHPEGLSPLSTQQIEDDEQGRPDAITERVLQTKPKHSVKAIRNRSQSAREQSKQRVYQRLAEMAEQLDAIDEVSKHMEDDFKNTKLMLNTVEQLSDTMTSTANRPKPDNMISDQKTQGPKRPLGHPSSEDPLVENPSVQPLPEDPGDKDVATVEEADKKLHVTIREDEREEGEDVPERGPTDDTGGEDKLGITGLSGVSDIIAEALADEDAKDLGISEETRQKLIAKRAKKQQETELDTLDFTNLSRDQLRDIFTPRSLTTPDEDEDLIPSYAKKPSERSESQRKELKEWMAKKQVKNITEYKKRRDELAEREPHPYQPPKTAQTQLGATHKVIKKAEQIRDGKRRTADQDHFQERTKAARQLMAEIIAETPTLPPEQESHRRPLNKSSKPNQTVTRPVSSGRQRAPSRDTTRNRQPQAVVPKGTYLFIDSGVYPGGTQTPGFDRQDRHDQTGRESSIRRSEVNNQRVPPIHIDYSSDEDFGMLGRISERAESKENEPVRDYRPKSYKKIVKVQRPEVTRKKRSSPRKQKTYGEMLKDLKQETSKPGSASSQRAKQRLYGSKRIPGSHAGNERRSPRVAKPYTERLAEMKGNTQTLSRLKVRPKPKRPSFGKETMTLDTSFRRQQVEGRGLRAETTPRTSTPYTERLGMLSNSGTLRDREGVISPAPKLGLKYKPLHTQPSNYVDRLHETSESAPRPKHKTAYVGALGTTYKSPQLHTPSPRPRPYRVPSQEDQDHPWGDDDIDDEGALSGMSDISPWSVSDEVKRILQGDSKESLAKGYTTDEDFAGLDSLDYQNDYLAAVDVRELEEIASIGSESIINMDWDLIDKMIADVE